MKKCPCYDTVFIGLISPANIKNVCNGTRERDECFCGGNPAKCDFYPEKRVAYNKSKMKKRGRGK